MRTLNREADLRAAALRLFREKGYHATSMRDIADELGLLKGSLYHYIRSKEELLARLFEGALEDTLGELGRIAAGAGSATERLRLMVGAYVLAILRNRDAVGVYLREWRSLPPDELSRVRSRRRSMRRLFERVIAEGARTGEFRATDPQLATLAVLGMCNWVYEWYRPRGRLSPGEIADAFAALAIGSLGSR